MNYLIEIEKNLFKIIFKDEFYNSLRDILKYIFTKPEQELPEVIKDMFQDVSGKNGKISSYIKKILGIRLVWIAFLLYDEINNRFQILGTCVNLKGKAKERHDLVRDFILSPQFREIGITEILTDIILKNPEGIYRTKWGKKFIITEIFEFEHLKFTEKFKVEQDNSFKESMEKLKKWVKEQVEKKDKDIILNDFYNKLSENIKEIINNFNNLGDLGKGKDINDISRGFLGSYIWNRLLDDKWKYIYYIPAIYTKGSTTSGVVVAFNKLLCSKKLFLLLSEIISRIFSPLHIFISHHNQKIYALRSAVAAIMARNMSHNIGSHVLNYLSNPEEVDNLWVI